MPRPKASIPEYKFHISGQARVWLDGEWRYLGEYDSPESRAKFFAILQVYEANGRRLPDDSTTRLDDAPVTVRCVTAEYRSILDERHPSKSHRDRMRNLCTTLEDEYGDEPVTDFGPRKLESLRSLMVASGNSRRYINRQIQSIVAIFKHAVSRELIGPERIVALQTLEPLRAGRTKAKEGTKRKPADLDDVAKTLLHLSPQVAAMVKLQVLVGARPSEIYRMTPGKIDRSGDVWIYDLGDEHTTAHHDRRRVLPFVLEAQAVLAPFLLRGADEPCFSPAESAQWFRDQRSANRKTPPKQGNAIGTNRKANPKRTAGKQFTKDSYNRAVVRGCEKAGVKRWTPYQLRHTSGTEVRQGAGLEGAQSLLGHSDSKTTEIYAQPSWQSAIDAAIIAAERIFPKIAV